MTRVVCGDISEEQVSTFSPDGRVQSYDTDAGHLDSNINKNCGDSSVKVPVGGLEKFEPARRNNITSAALNQNQLIIDCDN